MSNVFTCHNYGIWWQLIHVNIHYRKMMIFCCSFPYYSVCPGSKYLPPLFSCNYAAILHALKWNYIRTSCFQKNSVNFDIFAVFQLLIKTYYVHFAVSVILDRLLIKVYLIEVRFEWCFYSVGVHMIWTFYLVTLPVVWRFDLRESSDCLRLLSDWIGFVWRSYLEGVVVRRFHLVRVCGFYENLI